MITPTCSKCRAAIPSDEVNVARDVAYCRTCNISYPLSALTSGAELDAGVDLRNPPAGAWYRSDGSGTVIGATHRSVGAAFATLAVALFWNGIVSVFVTIALAGTLRNLHITLPHWFPAPDMNGSPMSLGVTLFLWLFLTPFIVIGLVMIGALLSSLGGRTEVRVHNGEGVVFSGIGPLGFRKRFDARTIREVRIDDKSWRDNDGDRQRKTHIVIETRAGKLIKLGSMLREDRRKFVASAVRKTLVR